jgi:hypothetical protein
MAKETQQTTAFINIKFLRQLQRKGGIVSGMYQKCFKNCLICDTFETKRDRGMLEQTGQMKMTNEDGHGPFLSFPVVSQLICRSFGSAVYWS